MYDMSVQSEDERMINVHYYYYNTHTHTHTHTKYLAEQATCDKRPPGLTLKLKPNIYANLKY